MEAHHRGSIFRRIQRWLGRSQDGQSPTNQPQTLPQPSMTIREDAPGAQSPSSVPGSPAVSTRAPMAAGQSGGPVASSSSQGSGPQRAIATVALAAKHLMDTEPAQQVRGALAAQIPDLLTAIATALGSLTTSQRAKLIRDLDADLSHLINVCREVAEDLQGAGTPPPKSNGNGTKDLARPLEKAMGKLEYVANHLISYYEKYARQLGPSAPRLSTSRNGGAETVQRAPRTSPLKPETVKRLADDLRQQAQRVITQLENMRKHLAGSQVATLDALTYALSKLVTLSDEITQGVNKVRAALNQEDLPMVQVNLKGRNKQK